MTTHISRVDKAQQTDYNQISIVPWVELVGIVRHISADKSYAYVELENRLLRVNQATVGSEVALDAICQLNIGKKVSILFTDLPTQPIVVRAVKHNPSELCTIKNLTDSSRNNTIFRKE